MIHIEDHHSLKRWILQSLRRFSVSNPDVLATYAISVVNRGHNNLDQVRQSCLEELETFLKGQTSHFVDLLIDAISDDSYMAVDADAVDNENDEQNSEWNHRRGHDDDGQDDDDDDGENDRRRGFREEESESTEQATTTHKSSHSYAQDNGSRGAHDYQDRHRGVDRDRGSNWNNRDRRDRDRDRDRDREGYRHGGLNTDRDRKRPREFDNRSGYDRKDQERFNFPSQPHMPPDGGAPPPWGPPPPGSYNPYDPYAPNMMYGWGQPPVGPPGYMHHPPPFAPLPPYPYGPPYGATPYMPPTIDNTATYAPPPLPPQANPGVNPTDGQNVMAGAIPPPPLSEIPTDSMVDSESPEKPSSGQPLYQPAGEYNQTGQPRDHNANTDYPYGTSSGGAGAATNPSPVPVTYHNYGVNSYMPPPPYNAGPSRDMNNGGNFSKKPRLGQSSNQLPENERCTLRCTGIPTYVKEEDLKVHFEAFGHVVELQLSPMATNDQHDKGDGDGGSEKKRTYNECLVQFFSAQNAKKCFTSPSPVLNNRFIHLHMSKFNIIPPCDVEVPSQEIIERDHLLLSQDVVPQAVAVKKKPQTIIKPATTKWKRSDAAAAKPTSQEGEASVEPSSSSIADGVNPVIETPKKETEISKEGIALKQNFEQLKALKQQAEESLKKKETVLQSQLEQCREMMKQSEKMPESESKATVVHNLEVKIVALQAQLRTVHDQIEKGQLVEKQSPPAKVPGNYYNPAGYRPHGGRMGGGRFYSGRNYYGGGGRGRGGYMGGRGAYMGGGYGYPSSAAADQPVEGGHVPMEDGQMEDAPVANLNE